MPTDHAVFARLSKDLDHGPLVVAHRGDSRNHPENTLAAFRAAAALGVPMQEFDVQATRDGALVCLHDAAFDRTTDSAARIGPGALVAHCTLAEAQALDAGSWFDAAHRGERVPTLANALRVMLPGGVPLIEHKGGDPAAYVECLRGLGVATDCILQSFDWAFVRRAHELAPELGLAVLGPTPAFPHPVAAALAKAIECGARMLHWHAKALGRADVARIHAAGLLVCSYTTDDELGWTGGAGLGIDAMCTNDPAGMLRVRASGVWRHLRPGNP